MSQGFQKGNKHGQGRPRGSKNKKTKLMQGILEEHSEALLHKGLVVALSGDATMLRYFLDHLLPKRKESAVSIGPLPLSTPAELVQAQQIVIQEFAAGELTPGDARQFDILLETCRRQFETRDIEQRVKALENFTVGNDKAKKAA